MNSKTLQLAQGTITLTPLTPAGLEQLHAVEAANHADPGTEIALYMPLIEAAVSEISTQQVDPDLQTVLSYEDSTSLWRVIRTLYEVSGQEFPQEYASKCEGSSLA